MCGCVAPDAISRCKLGHTVTTTIALLAHLALAAASGQPSPALRIVVIEGEDAVNVIQQKTAVAPVVEIRDRNNLPVAGATVTFTIGSNTASFAGGLQTITVATNAAGQAAAVAINPIASGAVQIQVAAAFQGQAAAATIVQTNVLTAAQAATAAGASSAGASSGSAGGSTAAGGAAGGGGGVSGTTIGVVGAAVAGGALAATQVAGGDEPANDGPATRIFRGAFASTITLRVPGVHRIETWVGTLEMAMPDNGAIDGNASITGGTTRVESVTCRRGPQLGATGTSSCRLTPDQRHRREYRIHIRGKRQLCAKRERGLWGREHHGLSISAGALNGVGNHRDADTYAADRRAPPSGTRVVRSATLRLGSSITLRRNRVAASEGWMPEGGLEPPTLRL